MLEKVDLGQEVHRDATNITPNSTINQCTSSLSLSNLGKHEKHFAFAVGAHEVPHKCGGKAGKDLAPLSSPSVDSES